MSERKYVGDDHLGVLFHLTSFLERLADLERCRLLGDLIEPSGRGFVVETWGDNGKRIYADEVLRAASNPVDEAFRRANEAHPPSGASIPSSPPVELLGERPIFIPAPAKPIPRVVELESGGEVREVLE